MFFLISCITENRSVERQSVAGYSACCGVRGRRCFQPGPHIPGKYTFYSNFFFLWFAWYYWDSVVYSETVEHAVSCE